MIAKVLLVIFAALVGSSLSMCPTTWTHYEGYCYRYYGTPYLNWMNAEQFCVNEGSHLVSIHNQQEYDFVKLIWRSMRNEHHVMDIYNFKQKASQKPFLYIGLNDILTNGVFHWTDNTPVDFTDWMPNNPSLDIPEEGVMIWDRPSRRGIWNDVPANSKKLKGAFMCKKIME
ncbi:snaclec alboaggregin-A subunit beta'-like [Apostichopus japonicus]|uniref:snaclec alboaggregin-A subunit beta'-like n=1 Tax=Stichopus japonicus TaxID=307972 RepID=UPI003AB36CC1